MGLDAGGRSEDMRQDVGGWSGSRMHKDRRQVGGLGKVNSAAQDVSAISTRCSSTQPDASS